MTRIQAFTVVVCTHFLGGCMRTDITRIKPAELPKIANNEARASGRSIQTVDGRHLEVEGEFDVAIPGLPGALRFLHPVHAEQNGEQLVVRGALGRHCICENRLSQIQDCQHG